MDDLLVSSKNVGQLATCGAKKMSPSRKSHPVGTGKSPHSDRHKDTVVITLDVLLS